jgi:hypothetical protein
LKRVDSVEQCVRKPGSIVLDDFVRIASVDGLNRLR